MATNSSVYHGDLCRIQSGTSFILYISHLIELQYILLLWLQGINSHIAAPLSTNSLLYPPLFKNLTWGGRVLYLHKYYHFFLAMCVGNTFSLHTGQTGRFFCSNHQHCTVKTQTEDVDRCSQLCWKLVQTGLYRISWWFIYLRLNRKSYYTNWKLPINHHFKGHILNVLPHKRKLGVNALKNS